MVHSTIRLCRATTTTNTMIISMCPLPGPSNLISTVAKLIWNVTWTETWTSAASVTWTEVQDPSAALLKGAARDIMVTNFILTMESILITDLIHITDGGVVRPAMREQLPAITHNQHVREAAWSHKLQAGS